METGAAEGGASAMEGITTALTTAFTSIQGDILGILAAVVPVAIVLFGGLYAVRWGKKAFQAAAN